jgi:hypothetical protein
MASAAAGYFGFEKLCMILALSCGSGLTVKLAAGAGRLPVSS